VKESCDLLIDLLIEYWDPLYILVTVEATNFKFGMQINHEGSNENKCKIRSWTGQMTYRTFRIFGALYISETVQTRNFKFGNQSDREVFNENMQNYVKGLWRGHVTYF